MTKRPVVSDVQEVEDSPTGAEQEGEDSSSTSECSYYNRSRRKERSLIFHLLYAAESFEYDVTLEAIVDNFNRGFDQSIEMDSEIVRVVRGVIAARETLDETIKPYLSNWRFERVSVAAKLVLRLAFWEMLYTDLAATVVINEAIELAKCFAESDAYRFINGVLDSFVKKREAAAEEHQED